MNDNENYSMITVVLFLYVIFALAIIWIDERLDYLEALAR